MQQSAQVPIRSQRGSVWLAPLALVLSLTGCSGGGGGGGGPIAPAIAYDRGITIGAVGVSLDPLQATAIGALGFSITPALPTGLTFDPTTGEIAGVPAATAPATVHTITADFGIVGTGVTAMPVMLDAQVEIEVVQPVRFFYATNGLDDTLSTWTLDATSGGLEPGTYRLAQPGDTQPATPGVHPNGVGLAIPHQGSGTTSISTLDPATGELVHTQTLVTGIDPIEVAYHPSGSFCWVLARGSDELLGFDVDPVTQNLTPMSASFSTPAGSFPVDVELARDGSRLAIVSSLDQRLRVFDIDAATGALTSTGTLGTGGGPVSLAIARDGERIWVANEIDRTLTIADLDGAGVPALVEHQSLGSVAPRALTADPTGRYLYAIDNATARLSSFSIGPEGRATLMTGTISAGSSPSADGIVIDPTGSFLWAIARDSSEVRHFALDPVSGIPSFATATRTRGLPNGIAFATGSGPVVHGSANVYVANGSSNDVTNFDVDSVGDLNEIGPPSPASGSPTAITVHPSGKYVYAIRKATQAVAAFLVDPLTDRLGLMAVLPTGLAPQSLVVEPSGRFLYVANSDDNSISIFQIDESNGNLSPATTPTANGGPRPISLAVDPTGRFLFVGNSGFNQPTRDITSLAIDPVDGSLTEIDDGLAGGRPNDIIVHPSGRFGYSALDNTGLAVLWSIQPTGEVTPIVGRLAGEAPKALTIDRTGRFLYVASKGVGGSGGDVNRYSIDPVTGVHTNLGPTLAGTEPLDVVADAVGTTLYVVNQASNDVSVFTISTVTGGLSLRATVPAGLAPGSIGLRNTVQ